MIKPKCMRAGTLIAARGAGLSRADGLWLEEHISGCRACAEEAAVMNNVVAVAHSMAPELSNAARSRAMRRALAAHPGGASAARQELSTKLIWSAGLAVAAAAVIALAAVMHSEQAGDAPSAALPQPPAVQQQLAIAPQLSRDAEQLQAGVRVRMQARTQVTLDHASVELAPQSEAQWNAATHELALPEGELLAEVDPSAHKPFAVVTRAFRVEVLGTRFEVTQSSVSVLRGHVRVVSPEGRELAVLLAGERYDHVVEAGAEPLEASEPVAVRNGRVNVAALLTQARDALAAGQLERSRRAIESALVAKPSAAARAEALTLRAELFNVQGDRASAIKAYLEVAERFKTMAAGENALFAAARLERKESAARALLTRYLERYPRGRFVVEAKYRLERSTR